MASHPFEFAREATLSALTEYAMAESRIAALWLQGSLAAGGADPFSDIDAYLAIGDDDYDAMWADREAVLTRLGRPLAWATAAAPGMAAVHALMPGGVRLDLFFEKAASVDAAPRPAVKVLVDKAGIAERLKLGWEPSIPVVARSITTIIRMTRQGATWPLRVLGRGQWPTLAAMQLDLINRQIAQLLAVSHGAGNFYKNPNALAQLLTDDERAELADLTDAALKALAARDVAALKGVQLRIHDALVEAGRAACATLGVDYPIDAVSERAVRDLIEASWPAG
jgi:predicted nucleotidyltransferase